MSDFAIPDDQAIKQAYAEMVAQSQVIKQRNLLLEKKHAEYMSKIKELTTQNRESSEHFVGYQKQTKQEKERADAEQIRLERNVKDLENRLEEMQSSYEDEIRKIHEANTLKVKELDNKIYDLESRSSEADQFLNQKSKMEEELANLQERLENEKNMRLEQVNQKELDRIKETEQLRKEMLFNIKKTKANLLAMNDKQLQTTTHLTILQNHQLTTELEHQSKQTEILIFKNNKMKSQIETYQREIEIHKEVEKELAKRSHFCQKVIKRLKQELSEATASKGQVGNTAAGNSSRNNYNRMGKSQDYKGLVPGGIDPELTRGNEDLINFLEQKLEQQEKQIVVKQQEYDALLQEHQSLQSQFNQSKQKYKRAALLLTEFLDDILNESPNILQPDKDLHLNVEKIKETPIEELPKEDKVTLVLVLLKQLQPYFSTHNLNVAPPMVGTPNVQGAIKKPAPIDTTMSARAMGRGSGSQPPMSGRNNRAAQKMLSAEEEGINRILNNINVQTRKAGEGTNLPPIQQR